MGELKRVEKEVRNIDELSIVDIRWVIEDEPRGLKIFKWTRGRQ